MSIRTVLAMRVTVLSLAVVTPPAALSGVLDEADALYANGKWLEAIKAYDTAAAGKVPLCDRMRAVLRASLSRERLGEHRAAVTGAERVIREAKGRDCDRIVGEAFLLKQRWIFRAKHRAGAREALLRDAVRRIGWTPEVSRLHELEARQCLREKKVESARRTLSDRRIALSPFGSNIVAVLSFAKSSGQSADGAAVVSQALADIDKSDHAAATTLADAACAAAKGGARLHMAFRAAEMAAAAGEERRACRLYDEALSECVDHAMRQRLRLRYIDFLKTRGLVDRCLEVYADWAGDLREGESCAGAMRKYVGYLMCNHRLAAARDVVGRFCGKGSGVYSDKELGRICEEIERGISSGEDDAELSLAWKLVGEAGLLQQRGKFGEAAKAFRSASLRCRGTARAEALFRLGECYRAMGKHSMAASAWDGLAAEAGDDERIVVRCLRSKGEMLFADLGAVEDARALYCGMLERMEKHKLIFPSEDIDDVRAHVAMCDVALGDVDKAEPVFRRKCEEAERMRSPTMLKWHALVTVCEAAREHAELGGTGVLRDAVIADLLLASERFAAADRRYQRCLRCANLPEELRGYMMMQRADCLSQMDEGKAALGVYRDMQKNHFGCSCAPKAMLRAGILCVGPLEDDAGGFEFFKFIEDMWPGNPMAEKALFYRLTLAIWTKRWALASELSKEFVKRHPDSSQVNIVTGEYGELIARRITALESSEIK